ncbi:uncharacterized protein JCM6883_000730 [Sporobolomyces salmoneus]|uniref:uncharacterized protein n=1 Tax=Sporobolomyces salmoneus TaxID=183962 RepID=UPI0031798A27
MLAQSPLVVTLLFATALVSAAPSPFSSTRISGDVLSSLAKRADSDSTHTVSQSSYLEDLFSYQTKSSQKACAVPLADLETCAKGTDQATIAACACSTQTLGDLRACAASISTTTKSAQNATQVVVSYNSFVDLCQTEGLATVTGTIAPAQSTSVVSRSSTATSAASSSAISSHATYNAQSTPTSTASVPALETPQVSGVNNSNAAQTTNSATSSRLAGGSSIVALLSAAGIAIYTLF